MNWDQYFTELALHIREKSKDPSSKIGALIVAHDHSILSTGFNGFPRGIGEADPKRWERPIKYEYVEHAERNAIYNAARHGIQLSGSTLYLCGFGPPTVPCTACSRAVIQSGIVRVVGISYKIAPDNWKDDLAFSKQLLEEAGIEFVEFNAS